METDFQKNFGIVISLLLPGFVFSSIVLFYHARAVKDIGIIDSLQNFPTSGVLLITLASLSIGLLLSVIRSITLDRLFRSIYLSADDYKLDYSALLNSDRREQFILVNENFYKFYQNSGNTLVALLSSAILTTCFIEVPSVTEALLLVTVCGLLFWGASDSWQNFYRSARQLNGNHPSE